MRKGWRDGNLFTLLPGHGCYVPEMLSAIDEAKESVLFEQYLMSSGQLAERFVAALIRAAKRGVLVRVLLDGVGSKDFISRDRERLRAAGVLLYVFNPFSVGRLHGNLTRNHRKLLLVDRKRAYCGGYCISDETLDWFDLAMRAEGPVVEEWHALFMSLCHSPLTRLTGEDEVGTASSRLDQEHAGDMRGRVLWGHGHREQSIRYSLQQRIASASRRAWLCTPYFLPTRSLRRSLIAAAKRGVDVRLLVAGKCHDHPSVRYAGQSYYAPLLRAGVKIHEYQARFTHAKYAIVDEWCTLGSCNFDHWSLRWNLEANQEVENDRFVAELAELFETQLDESKEVQEHTWERRPVGHKLRVQASGKVSAWLTFLH
ncbi:MULTISPECIES: phosphatidylserine/phosphatidylglycerophosphate/cardiolipin synthase family protein [Halomonadaceae]|uniref:phospholipase D-like domain-containing protein n=1 Tax=Halomonadaceae TaxID=28256 RepID=UPI0015972975|nr:MULTISPECIES: phospholipase D-like domain-containing protein [Halomonas]QJQ94227.1 phosphatidylserine/phosphatidylglycerophosphate/cardiolipin synthase family protein [Halomonas sp. PA5]